MSATGSAKLGKRELPAPTPQEGLDVLAAAINFCQLAGLQVRANSLNVDVSVLVITIEDVQVASSPGGETRLVYVAPDTDRSDERIGRGEES